jgi:hypothetical protein
VPPFKGAERELLLAELFFRRRSTSKPLLDLQAAINRFVAETNHDPKPFFWTADPNNIIAAVKRGRQVLDSIH